MNGKKKKEIMESYVEHNGNHYGPTIEKGPKCPDIHGDDLHNGPDREEFFLSVAKPVSEQAMEVIDLMLEWVHQFNLKNQDYTNSDGNVADNFGVMGQFMKLKDKIHKLKKPLWDNQILIQAGLLSPKGPIRPQDMNFEDAEEILDDIIGHALLAKLKLRERK